MANQARLDQIQKILFQPRRQPRQGPTKRERSHRHRVNQSSRQKESALDTEARIARGNFAQNLGEGWSNFVALLGEGCQNPEDQKSVLTTPPYPIHNEHSLI